MDIEHFSDEHVIVSTRNFLSNIFTINEVRSSTSIGIHLTGQLQDLSVPPTRFNFRIESSRECHIKGAFLLQWNEIIESESVIFIYAEKINDRIYRYCFLILHDWLLHHPDWYDRIHHQKDIGFDIGDFSVIDGNESHFEQAMFEEAHRIQKQHSALWQTGKSRFLPVNEGDIFKHFGHLGSLEVPQAVFGEVQMRPGLFIGEDERRLLRNLWSLPQKYRIEVAQLPVVRDWVNQIRRSPSPSAIERERAQFLRFVFAMEQYDGDQVFSMPQFSWEEVSSWRIFFLIFPESMRLLTRFFSRPGLWHPSHYRAALLLTSALANTDNPVLADKSRELMRTAADYLGAATHVGSYHEYAVLRQFYFARAEAEGGNHVQKCLDFLHRHRRHGDDDWEFRLLRGYYNDTGTIAKRAALRKLQRPKARDLNTISITELTYERLIQSVGR